MATGKPKPYDPAKLEKKWQKTWQETKAYETKESAVAEKCYVLDMFPYPSGDGLHVGHPRGYIATDVYSRFKKMRGFNILHPMGWDAFGLPAENYAIKNRIHPRVAVEKNIKRFKEQLSLIGFNYDWSREINTTDPEYYKWTQWIFLQLYKKGLAYQSFEPINWCPSCQTGLANEDVEDGKCERCSTPVEKKPMRQWVLKITEYADRLLQDLEATEYQMPKVVDNVNPHQPGKPVVTRRVAHAIVFDPKTQKYLIIRNKKFGWDTVIIGGIEGDEDAVTTAQREIREETGYTDLEFKRLLGGPTEASYYTKHKGENRIAIAQAVYFELKSDTRVPIAEREDENDEVLWVSKEDFVPSKMVNSELPIWLERLADPQAGLVKPLLDWPRSIKEAQKNWIGKSEGVEIKFKIENLELESSSDSLKVIDTITVFTTRPDTIFGVTFVAIAPELAKDWLEAGWQAESELVTYIDETLKDRAKQSFKDNPEKTGVFSGVYAINPANQEKVPVWITNYALGDVGTGAIMAVPAHDERDFEFAKKYNLPIKKVIYINVSDKIKPAQGSVGEYLNITRMTPSDLPVEYDCWPGYGELINSGEFDGLSSEEAKKVITEFVGGKLTSTYKLKDWVFSRQRYWGEPIPIIHCQKCGVVPVPEQDLPVKLPEVKSYAPTGTGESPLADISEWVNTTCPSCQGPAKRETNTMPQWAGSSWYYLRFMDPTNTEKLVDPKKEKYWAPVDMYVGGSEHATRHLIYARFWHKFLYDIGIVSTPEPFKRIGKNLGLILGSDGRKMSKRWGNVVNPDDVIKLYGADTLRLYEMFMGPFDQEIAWNTDSMIGARRFLEKVWRLQDRIEMDVPLTSEIEILLNQTIKKVEEDIEGFNFNTAIASLMILLNSLEDIETIPTEIYKTLLLLLAPFAPHITEELWESLGNKESIHQATWPSFDPDKLQSDRVTIVVQVSGKVRDSFEVVRGTGEEELKKLVLKRENVKKWLNGSDPGKIIFIPDKLINLVV